MNYGDHDHVNKCDSIFMKKVLHEENQDFNKLNPSFSHIYILYLYNIMVSGG